MIDDARSTDVTFGDEQLMSPDEYRVKWGEDPDPEHQLPRADDMTDKDCDLLRVAMWYELQKRNELN